MPTEPQDSTSAGGPSAISRRRTILVLFEAFLVVALAVFFLYSKFVLSRDIDTRTDLLALFVYSFPSEFLVGLVPHEPALIHYGTLFHPLVVALVSVVGTVMAEGLNYSFFGLFYEMPGVRLALKKKGVKRATDLFNRMPFIAILFAGFGPVPFFPIRFLVVITEYSRWKYLFGVFISRAPRFYILAWLGEIFEFSPGFLITVFVGMLVFVNIPAAISMFSGLEGSGSPWTVAPQGPCYSTSVQDPVSFRAFVISLTSSSGSTGFVRIARAPERAAWFNFLAVIPEMAITRTHGSSSLRLSRSSSPFSSGMTMSVTTRSTFAFFQMRKAASPFGANSVSWPACWRTSAISTRSISSSSTMRILAIFFRLQRCNGAGPLWAARFTLHLKVRNFRGLDQNFPSLGGAPGEGDRPGRP